MVSYFKIFSENIRIYIYKTLLSKATYIAFRLYIFFIMCVPWESNPQPFTLQTQCSTTEPQVQCFVFRRGVWKYSWAYLVMSMSEPCWWEMQYRLRARRTRASNKGLWPCPLRTEIYPVSLNLLMMLCTVDDEICKVLTLRNFVFKVFHNLFTHSFTDWRASAHLYFWDTLYLSKTSLL